MQGSYYETKYGENDVVNGPGMHPKKRQRQPPLAYILLIEYILKTTLFLKNLRENVNVD